MLLRSTKAIKVYFSYSHRDTKMVDKIKVQLLAEQDLYDMVQDLLDADVILLFFSPDYIADDASYRESQLALSRREANKAYIIPILLRPVFVTDDSLDTQALPLNGLPLTTWRNRDEAIRHVVEEIRRICLSILDYDKLTGNTKTLSETNLPPQAKSLPLTNVPTKNLELLYCYAREDKELRNYLETHLKLLKRQFHLKSWYDQEIIAGKDWKDEIETHLNTSDIILLLVSPDFMASEYCYTKEMKRALERHTLRTAHVIPILLRDVDWEDAPFSHLQVLPTDAEPITLWSDRDAAFANVARGIRRAVKDFIATRTSMDV